MYACTKHSQAMSRQRFLLSILALSCARSVSKARAPSVGRKGPPRHSSHIHIYMALAWLDASMFWYLRSNVCTYTPENAKMHAYTCSGNEHGHLDACICMHTTFASEHAQDKYMHVYTSSVNTYSCMHACIHTYIYLWHTIHRQTETDQAQYARNC